MSVTRCFTFGYGHVDPADQSSLAGRYARITASTADQCRDIMVALFSNKWAFEYGEDIEQDWTRRGLDAPQQRYRIEWGDVHTWTVAPGHTATVPANLPTLPKHAPVDDWDDEETLARGRAAALLDEERGPDWPDDTKFHTPGFGIQTAQPKGDIL